MHTRDLRDVNVTAYVYMLSTSERDTESGLCLLENFNIETECSHRCLLADPVEALMNVAPGSEATVDILDINTVLMSPRYCRVTRVTPHEQ